MDKAEKRLVISATQLRKFKTCPRSWHLRYVERLWPVYWDAPAVLNIGSALHKGLEKLHGGETVLEACEAAKKKLRPADSVVFDGEAISLSDPAQEPWVVGMLQAYASYEKLRFDGTLGLLSEVERWFPVKDAEHSFTPEETEACTVGWVGDVRVLLCGAWDGFGDGAIVEHKSVYSLSAVTPDDLAVDDQVSAMCWAASRLKGKSITRCIYNLVAKPQIKFQSRGNEHESAAQYAARVYQRAMSTPSKWFERLTATRTEQALESWQENTMRVARAMLASTDGAWGSYMGAWNGPCRRCMFMPICKHWGTPMAQRQKEALFKEKERYDEKVDKEEPASE